MRVKIAQPPYPEAGEALKVLQWQCEFLESLEPGSVDLVLFPENSNCTGYAGLENMQVISEFYTYQIIKEIGEVWMDD